VSKIRNPLNLKLKYKETQMHTNEDSYNRPVTATD